jgi:hypothetical protein
MDETSAIKSKLDKTAAEEKPQAESAKEELATTKEQLRKIEFELKEMHVSKQEAIKHLQKARTQTSASSG